ncbi:hypothetical protein niasHS_017344 [Heterodera schachtii]|uniref:FAD-binding PCMH-type domain-containing protein n=1 Tax=Heterodera schachtii TaxID=97005 RepID=A0ABD2I6L4_HETSC
MKTFFCLPQFICFCLLFVIPLVEFVKSDADEDEDCEFNGWKAAIRLHNWGGNFNFSTKNIQYPRTTAQVQHVVTHAARLRVIGSRHSISKIGDSCDTILSTLGMNSVIGFNTKAATVTVQAGITYTDLMPILYANNFALPNLAATGEITVAGAIQTGVHGSGIGLQNLPSQVRSLQMVLANGRIAHFDANSPEFNAVTCGLGTFGVVTQVELNLVPSFDVITYVFTEMPDQNVYEKFDDLQNRGYTVMFRNTLQNASAWTAVIFTVVANSTQDENLRNLSSLYGANRQHSNTLISPIFIELNKVQPWYYGLLVYRLGMTGNDGNELQSEYFVPYKDGISAVKAISPLYPQIQPLLGAGFFLRTVKEDNFWMSMNYGNETRLALHFSWVNNRTLVDPVLQQIEEKLLKFDVRPHWAKYYLMKPGQFLPNYPRLEEFRQLAEAMDPAHKFRNKFIKENVFNEIKEMEMYQ